MWKLFFLNISTNISFVEMYYKSILPIPTHLQKKMMLDVNMLCTRVINRVLSESNAALIISKGNCYRYLRKSISSSNILNQTASFVAFECHVLHFHSWCCHFDRCGHCATNLSLLEYTTSSPGHFPIGNKSQVKSCAHRSLLSLQYPRVSISKAHQSELPRKSRDLVRFHFRPQPLHQLSKPKRYCKIYSLSARTQIHN